MTNVKDILVQLKLNDADFKKNMQAAESRISSMQGKMASAGKSMTMGFTAPLAAIGTIAVKTANDVDAAMNKIRIGTGATGEALIRMEETAKKLYTELPNDINQVASAVADLNTLLGLQGKQLEDISRQYLNLARMTDTDVSMLISSTTRMFNNWDIAASDYADTLDYLFRIYQSTGIEVTALSDKMSVAGASLRTLGFDFETAAVMMGQFEKEGVQVDTIISSLKMALARLAEEGITDAGEAFAELMAQIKAAPSDLEAVGIATEIFGSRAGSEMAIAIREGRFEFEELVKALKESGITIDDYGDETLTFADHLRTLKHEIDLMLEPLGEMIIDTLLDNKDELADVVNIFGDLIRQFRDMPDAVQGATIKLVALMAAIGPVLWGLSKLIGVAGAIKGGAAAAAGAAGVIGSYMEGIGLVLGSQAGASAIALTGGLGFLAAGVGYTAVDLWKNRADVTKGETQGDLNYYEGYNATTSYGMPYEAQHVAPEAENIESIPGTGTELPRHTLKDKADELWDMIRQVSEDYQNIQLDIEFGVDKASYDAAVEQIADLEAQINEKYGKQLVELSAEMGAALASSTLSMMDSMAGLVGQKLSGAEDSSAEAAGLKGQLAKYDITTREGLAFAKGQWDEAFSTDRLEQLGFSEDAIEEFQATKDIMGDQLQKTHDIEILADEMAAGLGYTGDELEVMADYYRQMLVNADSYKNSYVALLAQANAYLATIASKDMNVTVNVSGGSYKVNSPFVSSYVPRDPNADTFTQAALQAAKDAGLFTGTGSGLGMEIRPFADGGLVTSPTLGLIGEAGPEVIMPLDDVEHGLLRMINTTLKRKRFTASGTEKHTVRGAGRDNSTAWKMYAAGGV